MIYNFYSYLFITALASGAACAVLIRTIADSRRKIIWDISSASFLLLMILAAFSFFSGLIIADSEAIDFIRSVIFLSIAFILLTVLFYFLKIIGLPIILFILFLSAIYYHYNLLDFTPFHNTNSMKVKVLNITDSTISVEIRNFKNDIEFLTINGEIVYPVFTIIDFSDFIFFLNSSSYIKLGGFSKNLNNFKDKQQSFYNGSTASGLPFSSNRLHEPVPVEKKIYSSLEVQLEHSGSLNFVIENN